MILPSLQCTHDQGGGETRVTSSGSGSQALRRGGSITQQTYCRVGAGISSTMFGLRGEENSDDDLDFTPRSSKGSGQGLGNMFGPSPGDVTSIHNASKLTYQPPKQPTSKLMGSSSDKEEDSNGEKIDTQPSDSTGFELMSNIKPGVKMATAVIAYKLENKELKPLGKLGLAIIGKKESNLYQLLLYRGKQEPVAIANLSPTFQLNIQQNNYANFVDEQGNSWTICFDSLDLLVNLARQVLLCQTVWRGTGGCLVMDLEPGEGKPLARGDGMEVQVTSWKVTEAQGLGVMVDTTKGARGLRFKLGAANSPLATIESALDGMKKGGRRFIISGPDDGGLQTAYDIELTRVKQANFKEASANTPLEIESEVTTENKSDNPLMERMAKLGQAMVIPKTDSPSEEEDQILIEPEHKAPPSQINNNTLQNGIIPPTGEFCPLEDSNPRSEAQLSGSTGTSFQANNQLTTFQQPQINPEWSMMMSETRMQNTEMRMIIQRMSDKVDTMLSMSPGERPVPGSEMSTKEILSQLDYVKQQNEEMKNLIITNQIVKVDPPPAQQDTHQTNEEYSQRLEMKEAELSKKMSELKEKEENLGKKVEKERSAISEEVNSKVRSEMKKLLSSCTKLLLSRFETEQHYKGDEIQDTVKQTMLAVYQKMESLYMPAKIGESTDVVQVDMNTDTTEVEV